MPTRKWGQEQLVTTSPGGQYSSDVAVLKDGSFVIVWEQDVGLGSEIHTQRYDAVGNKLGAERTIAAGEDISFSWPSITALSDGRYYITFTQNDPTNNTIFGFVYEPDGTVVRDQSIGFRFGADNEAVTARLGTGSAVAWYDPDSTSGDIVFRIYDSAGNSSGTLAVNSATVGIQRNAEIAGSPDGNKLAIVWQNNPAIGDFRIQGRLFDATGAETATEFRIDTIGGSVDDPTVTWLNNSEFVVTWTEAQLSSSGGGQIKARIFNGESASAVPLTSAFLVNSTTVTTQQGAQIVALPNGGFAIAWRDYSETGGDQSAFAIRLQAFDGAGGKIGGEILVNTTTQGDQRNPTLSALADGRIVVTFTDASSGTGDIRMQIIDPRDGIVAGTGAADTLYGHDAVGDEITGYAGNDVMYGLKGNDQLHGGEGADTAYGGLGDDALFGGDGNDVLLGGVGADELDGGIGSDTASYAGATAGIIASLFSAAGNTGEAAGDTYSLIENLTGSAFVDRLSGDAGVNILDGLAGADTMRGRGGSDLYRVDNIGDIVDEADGGGGGIDTVQSTITFSLVNSAKMLGAVENVSLLGAANINATGNSLANIL